MRVELAVVVLVLVLLVLVLLVPVLLVGVLLLEGRQVDDGRGVEHLGPADLLGRLVHGRLQGVDVDQQGGVGEGGGLADAELEVVRLAAGLGEVLDLEGVTGHALRDVLQRVEAGHHRLGAL